MTVSLIVAMSDARVIGRDGTMPWHLRRDLRRFKERTMGGTLIMGRKTFESIGRLLPGRQTVIVTRDPDYRVPGARVVHDLAAELQAEGGGERFVVGGSQIYALALPFVDRLYVTRVHADVAGDVHFPEIDFSRWRRVSQESFPADEQNDYPCTFESYERET